MGQRLLQVDFLLEDTWQGYWAHLASKHESNPNNKPAAAESYRAQVQRGNESQIQDVRKFQGSHSPFCCPGQLQVRAYSEKLEHIAQRGGRCSIPGNIQGQVKQGSEEPDLVKHVPAHIRGVGLDDL